MIFKYSRSALLAALLAAALAIGTPPTAALAEEVVEIKTRPGVTVKFILRGERAGNPPIAILFAGGGGVIDLVNWDGSGIPVGNFLVRTRKHWVKHNLLVAVPDAPSDMGDGNYRGSECGAKTAHGFRGIEKRVVRETAAWIHRIAGAGR